MFWWGAGTLGLGSALWYTGVAKAEAGLAAGFMGVMPVSALALSYLLLGEEFRWVHLAGFAVVFTGVLLVARAHAASEHSSASDHARHDRGGGGRLARGP